MKTRWINWIFVFYVKNILRTKFSMTSNFYIVHHEFRAGTSSKWWETAYAAMAPGGGWDEAVEANKEKGGFNHSANAVTANGPIYCIWEIKEGISIEEFQ